MTRIAIFLTAIPLAVALATLLNMLLDRRLAAVTHAVRPPDRSRVRGFLALLALSSLAAAPVLATEGQLTSRVDCTAIDCSLVVDSSQVESLWHGAPPGVTLVSQSPIPVAVEAIQGSESPDADGGLIEDDRPTPSPRIRAESVQTRP